MPTAFCRVCLMSNVKIHYIHNKRLQEIYAKLSGMKLNRRDRESIKICYMCFSHLQRIRKFSDLSHKSARILSSLLDNGVVMTQETVAALNLGTVQNLSTVTLPCTSIHIDDINITPEALAMIRLGKIQKLTAVTLPATSLDGDHSKNKEKQVNVNEKPVEIESSTDEDVEEDKIKNIEDFAKYLIEQVKSEPTTSKCLNKNVKTESTEPKQTTAILLKTTQIKTESSIHTISDYKCKIVVDENEKNEGDYDISILNDDKREAKITETLRRLMNLIDEIKPSMFAHYNMECELAKQKYKSYGVIVQARRLPKRRFPWCPRSRSLLLQLVKLAGSEQAGASLLATRALPLFPKGFVRMPALMKQANVGKYVPPLPSGAKRQKIDSDSYKSQHNDENETVLNRRSIQNELLLHNDSGVKMESNEDNLNELVIETPDRQ